MRMDDTTRAALARNVKLLREDAKWSQQELAKRAGVAQTAISYMERPESLKSPTIAHISKVAGAFGLAPWHLLLPAATVDVLRARSVDKLVTCYVHLNQAGRDSVMRVAETEVRYQTIATATASLRNDEGA